MDTLNDAGLDAGTGTPTCLLLGMDGDLAFSGGSLVMARGQVALAQRVRMAVLLWLGEWFLDVSAGTDWRPVFDAKPPNPVAVQGMVRTRIQSVPGVASVDSVEVAFDAAARRLSLAYSVTGTDGATVTGEVVR